MKVSSSTSLKSIETYKENGEKKERLNFHEQGNEKKILLI